MFIKEFIHANGFQYIAEIGVKGGNHARQIMDMCNDHLLKFVLVDPFRSYAELNQGNSKDKSLVEYDQDRWDDIMFKAYNTVLSNPKFFLMRMTSLQAAKFFINSSMFDFVFIDADHTYKSIIQDLIAWIPRIKNGGYISGDDYGPGWPDVVKGVHDVFGEPELLFECGGWAVQLDSTLKRRFLNNAAKCL